MDNDVIAGVKYATGAASFIGSALSLSYAKELTRSQAVMAFLTGAFSAIGASKIMTDYAGSPPTIEPAIAFFVGLFAMRLMPAVMDALVDNIKRFKFPGTKE